MGIEGLPTSNSKRVVRGDFMDVIELLKDRTINELPIVPAVNQAVGTSFLNRYLRGGNFEHVLPFVILEPNGDKKRGGRFFIGGRINGKTVTFNLNEEAKQHIKRAPILAIPYEDENKLYQWINFHRLYGLDRVNLDTILQSFRVDRENLRMVSWSGIERQLFLDYLSGRAEIEFHMLREFRVTATNSKDFFLGSTNDQRDVAFRDRDIRAAVGQELLFRPRMNGDGKTWLEMILESGGEERELTPRKFQKGDNKLPVARELLNDLTISPEEANEQLSKLLEEN